MNERDYSITVVYTRKVKTGDFQNAEYSLSETRNLNIIDNPKKKEEREKLLNDVVGAVESKIVSDGRNDVKVDRK